MQLADIRNPLNLDPPLLFGPAVKCGRGYQRESDTDKSEVFAYFIFHISFTSNCFLYVTSDALNFVVNTVVTKYCVYCEI